MNHEIRPARIFNPFPYAEDAHGMPLLRQYQEDPYRPTIWEPLPDLSAERLGFRVCKIWVLAQRFGRQDIFNRILNRIADGER